MASAVVVRDSRSTPISCTTTWGSNSRPGAGAQLAHRRPRLQRSAPRPVRGHRVEGVAGQDDAARERDVLARAALRIAAAVPVLVLAQDDLRDVAEARHPLEHLGPAQRVLLHHVPFVLVQRPGLQQDRVGDADLADVVQARGEGELRERRLVQFEPLAELAGQLHHVLGVVPRVVVAHVDRLGERLDAGADGQLEVLAHLRLLERHRAHVGEPSQRVELVAAKAAGGVDRADRERAADLALVADRGGAARAGRASHRAPSSRGSRGSR